MSVIIGSARSNESGKLTGGAAGDQTGREVSTQNWYLHSKGWIVIRAKDPAIREKIAKNMQAICDNNNIGYCQDHRTSLTTAAKPYGYDASKVKVKCEVDCSEAARNCVLYAGINVGVFTTVNERTVLKNTGKFDVLTSDKYCKSSEHLLRGDILVTRTKGHTVVALSNGSKAGTSTQEGEYNMKTIKKGSTGKAVKIWQVIIGVTADGIFGSGTEAKTKAWQTSHGLEADGIVGAKSWKAGLESV